MRRVTNLNGGRYTLYILAIAFTLGIYVSMTAARHHPDTAPGDSGLFKVGGSGVKVSVNSLRKEVALERDEYMVNETIVAQAVVVNDLPYPVRITRPSAFDATGYGVGSPSDEQVSQGMFITWADGEMEIPAGSSAVLCSFQFRADEPGRFIIRISGFPEREVTIVEPDGGTPLSLSVSVKLNGDTFSVDDTAKLIFTNRGPKDAGYGSQYDLEKLEGGEWVPVCPFPSPYAWTAVAIILPWSPATTGCTRRWTSGSGRPSSPWSST
jgi:hypothetical protein